MKMLASVFLIVVTALPFPSIAMVGDCLPSAQIIAKVGKVHTDNRTYCTAEIDPTSVTHFSHSDLCPLSRGIVVQEGVEFPLSENFECPIKADQPVNGVLLEIDGKIYLESALKVCSPDSRPTDVCRPSL